MRALAVLVVLLASSGPPEFTERSEQTLPLAFNQGIARVEGGWILSGNAIPTDLRSQGYNHIGDIDVVGDVIYAPFEQPNYDLVHQVTARYDATTVDLHTGETASVGTLGHQGAEGEGIDATALPSGAFHALVNDPFGATVYLGHYDLTTGGAASSPSSSSSSSSDSQSASLSSKELAATGGRSWWPTAAAGLFSIAACARLLGRRHP